MLCYAMLCFWKLSSSEEYISSSHVVMAVRLTYCTTEREKERETERERKKWELNDAR